MVQELEIMLRHGAKADKAFKLSKDNMDPRVPELLTTHGAVEMGGVMNLLDFPAIIPKIAAWHNRTQSLPRVRRISRSGISR